MKTNGNRNPQLAIAMLAGLCTCGALIAADHKEAPLIAEDPSADINDVYAFPSPNDPGRFCVMMTVNPLIVPAQNTNNNFSADVRYRFEFDLNNDGKPDRSVACTFNHVENSAQTMHVDFPGKDRDFDVPVTLPSFAKVAPEPTIANGPGGVTAFAGQRDDPFFFDLPGFNRFRAGTGNFTGFDAFAGTNVSVIVLEAPVEAFTGNVNIRQFQFYGATDRHQTTVIRSSKGKLETASGPWQQIERMGNPAISTALISKKDKDKFNIILPKDDAKAFGAEIAAALAGYGTNQTNIGILASVAIPDTLKLDLDKASGFPNGRRPQDDVIDTLLFFIFNQPTPAPTDGVNANDKPFLPNFPYLAAPHQPA